ncbi:MAG: hypothetical protein NTX82_01960 [Candidatus Parcubacteria bacterium]|nr:hypothetical protein [Candidatus Parcubacteria bacterium]
MKGKNKKTKKVARKSIGHKVKASKPATKRKASKKRSENVFGAKLPLAEVGTRIFVKQEEVDEPVAELEIAQEKFDNVLLDSLFPEFDFSEEELPAEQNFSDQDLIEPGPEAYSIKNNEMSNRAKTVIMYIAVTSIMAAIVFFWGLSVKYSLSQSMQNTADPQTNQDLEKIKSSLGGIKDDFFTISDFAKTQIDRTIKSEMQPNPVEAEPQIPDDITSQLKEKLQNLNTNSLNTNTANIKK